MVILLDWLADAGTWLADQWNWVTAVIVAVGVWFLARLRVFATKRTDAWIEARSDGLARWRKAQKDRRKTRRLERQHQKLLAKLESERVGALFRRRESRGDPGVLMEVIGLGPRQPKVQVRIRAVGAEPGSPAVLVQWGDLTRSEAEQRHISARLERDPDQTNGWVTYERVRDES